MLVIRINHAVHTKTFRYEREEIILIIKGKTIYHELANLG